MTSFSELLLLMPYNGVANKLRLRCMSSMLFLLVSHTLTMTSALFYSAGVITINFLWIVNLFSIVTVNKSARVFLYVSM